CRVVRVPPAGAKARHSANEALAADLSFTNRLLHRVSFICSGQRHQETICHKCEDGYYQLGPACHRFCPDGTYNADDDMVCSPCEDKRCVTCDQNQCYWCQGGFYTFDGQCVDHCKEGFFVDVESQECEPCHRDCRTCGGPGFDDCDSCEDGFKLEKGACLDQLPACPEGRFSNGKGECEQCHSLCRTCSAAGRENCTSCSSGRFLTPRQTCALRCPSGTFANETSRRCDECAAGCVGCRDARLCQHCRRGLHLQDGACVVQCDRGVPEGGACQPCAARCASCEGNSSHCLSCEGAHLLLDHTCQSQCPGGYYAAEAECRRCPAHCSECNEDGACKRCAEYYFLFAEKCVDDCPEGHYAEKDQCVRCHADCASCDGPGMDDCAACRNPKAVRYDGECLAECPTSTYYDEATNECRDCDRSCLTCSGHEPSSCLTCGANRTTDASGHCVWFAHCPLHSYVDGDGRCRECHERCHRCFGPTENQCFSCDEPRFLLNSTCVRECPAGFYAELEDGRACERCHFSCESCAGRHSLQCVACKRGFFKQGSSCVETCAESYFGNTTSMACARCDPSCSQCWGPGDGNCLRCRDSHVYLRQEGRCLHRCPPSYYQDRSKTCHRCHPTCKTCSGEGAVSCQSCYHGYRFLGGICESQCVVGFYAVEQAPEPDCTACDPSCLDCRGPSMWNCTVCPAAQLLSADGRCLSCCGNGSRRGHEPIPRECCDCQASEEECILGVNFVIRDAKDLESNTSKLFVTACVLLILSVGGGLFLFLSARSRTQAPAPKVKAGGYEQLKTNGGVGSDTHASSFGEYSDRIIEREEEEEDDEDDIVYMGQDGTVYRKFKYGLLDDDEIELEYDDESYTYR
ncbi:proprotein convertase subtilisin/kexin type 5-like, partial [Betta splendens]|uniref:Proprotein convertase subtilisin/kexin type 5-like n=1 Tax=Betta splendens TaxID=158456 RepID=A0A6P7NN89_BETSP